jgi:hypothetical protein
VFNKKAAGDNLRQRVNGVNSTQPPAQVSQVKIKPATLPSNDIAKVWAAKIHACDVSKGANGVNGGFRPFRPRLK